MTATQFSETMRNLDKGRVLIEASEALAGLIQSIKETGKKGSLTLKLDIAPTSADAETVTVAAGIKVNVPLPNLATTLFFTTEDCELTRRDPRQGDFEDRLREVSGAPAPA